LWSRRNVDIGAVDRRVGKSRFMNGLIEGVPLEPNSSSACRNRSTGACRHDGNGSLGSNVLGCLSYVRTGTSGLRVSEIGYNVLVARRRRNHMLDDRRSNDRLGGAAVGNHRLVLHRGQRDRCLDPGRADSLFLHGSRWMRLLDG
jgi:hypothetical protein